MASSARAATVVALAVILAPAIGQSGTADTKVDRQIGAHVIGTWLNNSGLR